jgi:hypothetical protein
MDVGVPRDEVKFYHEVLRRGQSLVIANADGEELAQGVRTVFKQQGGGDGRRLAHGIRESGLRDANLGNRLLLLPTHNLGMTQRGHESQSADDIAK